MRRLIGLTIVLCLSIPAFAQDSLNMTRVGKYEGLGYSRNSVKYENYLYVAANGLDIYDVSTPMPTEVTTNLALGARCVAIYENLLFVATGMSGFAILDITDPASPILVSETPIDGYCTYIAVFGDILLVDGSETFSLILYDVSDPTQPEFLSGIEAQWRSRVVVQGTHLFLSHYDGLKVLDISNPSEPEQIAIYPEFASINSFVLSNQTGYLSANGGLYVVDISNVEDVQTMSFTPIVNSDYGYGEMAIQDNLLVFAPDTNSIAFMDVSDPDAHDPLVEYVIETSNMELNGVVLDGSHAYLAMGTTFEIYDISDPSAPVRTAFVQINNVSESAVIIGNTALLSGWGYGLVSLDISNPLFPELLTGCQLPLGGGYDIAHENSIVATCINPFGCVSLADVSDPANPVFLYNLALNGQCTRLDLQDNHMYLACHGTGLRTYNISNPESPQLESVVPGTATAVDAVFPIVYFAQHDKFKIFDFSDPAQPDSVGSLPLSGINDIVVRGDLAYAATNDGLCIIDISNRESPQLVSVQGEYSRTVILIDTLAVLAAQDSGTVVYSVSDPLNPFVLGYYRTGGDCRNVISIGDSLLLSLDYQGATSILRLESPMGVIVNTAPISSTFSLSAFPNPFNPVTTIAFDLAARSRATIGVYNLSGQLVTTLLDESVNAGTHSVSFDGSSLSSGSYFVRLTTPEQTAVTKIVLMK